MMTPESGFSVMRTWISSANIIVKSLRRLVGNLVAAVFDRMTYQGNLKHFGGPMLRFNVENGQLPERGRSVALAKPRDIGKGPKKIV